jgi:hypothetical protein
VLRGFNFITPKVKVKFVSLKDSSIQITQDCAVIGDQTTPVFDAAGKVIIGPRVNDYVVFDIPLLNPNDPSTTLPPGDYEVRIVVGNQTNAEYNKTYPAELQSNALKIRILPDPNKEYSLFSNHGHCYEETDGLGSDEIWFDAFVGHFVVPNRIDQNPPLKSFTQTSFDRAAWDDMDSGEDANYGGNPANLFSGKFERGGSIAIGLIGFEVDSEDAAKEQLKNFGDAFAHYLKSVLGIAFSGVGAGGSVAKYLIEAGLITLRQTIIGLIVAVVAVFVVGLFWAAWAPADLIALDAFALDSLQAYRLTDPKEPLPQPTSSQFDVVSVTEAGLHREASPSASAPYVFERRYRTPEDDEDSSYGITFKLTSGN